MDGFSSSWSVSSFFRAMISLFDFIFIFLEIPGIPSVSPSDMYVSVSPVMVFL